MLTLDAGEVNLQIVAEISLSVRVSESLSVLQRACPTRFFAFLRSARLICSPVVTGWSILKPKTVSAMICLPTSTKRPLPLQLCLAAVLVAYAVLSENNASQAASPATRVAIAYPNATPRVAPLWIAEDLDFFGKYGLRAQVVLVRNNQMLSAGLAAGCVFR